MKKSILNDIGLDKTRLISTFINSPDICRLLLEKDSYTRIFPYLHINTQADMNACLCFEVDVPQIPTGMIKDMKIIVWSYCRLEQMQYAKEDYLGTKPDILADMAERELRASNQFGIGPLHLESVTNNLLENQFYGRQLVFTVPDFKMKG